MLFGFKKQKKAASKSSTDSVLDKTISDYKMEAFLKFGREQLMKLRAKGISIPVALL